MANHALMPEGADTREIAGSGAPSFGRLARNAREAAVVVGDKLAQYGVGGVEVGSPGEAQFAAQRIMELRHAILGLFLFLGCPYMLLLLLVIIPLQFFRARSEARLLEQHFGEQCHQYKARTWF